MAKSFEYNARNIRGELVRGEIEAEDIREVANFLREKGLLPVKIEEKKKRGLFSLAFSKEEKPKKVKLNDLVIFTRQFATMINSGLSMATALKILAEQTESKALRTIVREIQKGVDEGMALSEALSKFPLVFSKLYTNMIKAAEASGTLDETLERLATTLEKQQELRGKIRSAMTYPVAILIFAILVTAGLLIFLVPTFANMFESLGAPLPLPTAIILKISIILRQNFLIVSGVFFSLIYGGFRAIKNPKIKEKIDAYLLKTPLLGSLIEKSAIVNFSRVFATQIKTGVPILQALELVSQTVGNSVFSKAIISASKRIREGEKIAPPLRDSKIFPPMVIHMISVGEESGNLELMLNKIGDFYERELANSIESLTSLIEPLMLVVIGGLAGGILISLYLPIFTMFQYIK
ncbi:MAG: type II secretion system F family protein [Dictyoglomus sp.]|nr:type II secretion system F family protein [Dictyoglomus sp.]MCX7942482.1 type II secretion system F family protein [Dictyoglomaceae bacterium]MDW8187710.1 type II secretion system F family protein [Dictyoglomus sp.]